MAGSATPSLTGLLSPNHLLKQLYRIISQVYKCSMGAVYKAKDTLVSSPGNKVAIAVQLDGNRHEDPHQVNIDSVAFLWT